MEIICYDDNDRYYITTMISQIDNVHLLCGLVPHAVAQELVKRYPTLTELRSASEDELMRIRGIGKAIACRIQAALELSVRLTREVIGEKPILDSADKVADLLREETRQYHVEHFIVCLLNTRHRLIKIIPISQGTLDSILVHPREVFIAAIEARAAAILLVHNHPSSGDCTPSPQDIKVTRDLIRAGQLLKIEVLDHVIIGRRTTEQPKDYTSLRELGYMYT